MKWTLIFKSISLLLIFTFMTACASPGGAPTKAPVLTETTTQPTKSTDTAVSPDTGMPVTGKGLCANAYFPVREGSTWTYKSVGGPTGEFSFTDSVTSVREDGFTLTTQFDKLTRTQEWSCTSDGLVALQIGGPAAASLNMQDMQFNLNVENVSGVTFPNTISQGDQWQHTLGFTGDLDIVGQKAVATGNAQSSFTALGQESVTVAAGTFDAMKIQADTTLSITATVQGLSIPVTLSSTYTFWFAQGVGWVKASGSGDLGGQSFSESIELQSYSIP